MYVIRHVMWCVCMLHYTIIMPSDEHSVLYIIIDCTGFIFNVHAYNVMHNNYVVLV